MLQAFNLLLLLFMAPVRPVLMRPANIECSWHADHRLSYFERQYSNLYLKLEEALINDQKTLNELRAGFLSAGENTKVNFWNFRLEVNGTNSCGYYNSEKTFCNSSSAHYMWRLCFSHDMTFNSQSYDAIQYENRKNLFSNLNIWLSLIHGSTIRAFITATGVHFDNAYLFNQEQTGGIQDLTLRIELKCNPPLKLTKCVISELFSWIKVYSYTEAGSRPLTWDQNEKGSVSFYDNDDDDNDDDNDDDIHIMKFVNWPIDTNTFVKLALAEYVFVSLSLALLIGKFFPAIHSQIVSKAASSLEYQSLYWGSAVVANVFIYGLMFLAAKGLSTRLQCQYYSIHNNFDKCIYTFSIMQLVVYVMLFAGAIIASLRSLHGIPLPTGMGKVVINISFCFCCCVCCSPRCRAKTLQIMVLFSFMSFIYHSIMDAISIAFLLFDEEYRTLVITVTLLYISLIMFIIIFISFSLYLIFHGREKPFRTFHKQLLNCCGGSFMLVTVFGAVMLIVVMYMIIFFSLKLTGISGIATGLVPSIALSAATWYIKNKLFKEKIDNPSTTSAQSEYGATTYRESAVNDGGMEIADGSNEERRPLLEGLA